MADTSPSFLKATSFWLKLGFISFGGPAGQISIMHEFLVQKKKWIGEKPFMQALNFCMLLPGPEAQQLATYIGWKLHGVRGGIVAGTLFFLPSMVILLALSILYVKFGTLSVFVTVFDVLKPAVVAIIFHALFKIGKKSLLTWLHAAIAILSFVFIYFMNTPLPVILLCAAIFALILKWSRSRGLLSNQQSIQVADSIEHEEKSNYRSIVSLVLKTAIAFIILWTAPFILMNLFGASEFWKPLVLFFTKAAFITFGGAYAVLPYVAQESVEGMNWLTKYQMMDGLALGETTPGPLIMVLAFVGFMAGFNSFDQSLIMGTLALLVTCYYTFLPSFLFIFAGAPLIDKSHRVKVIQTALTFVTAAVVGVIFNLSVYLTESVIISKDADAGLLDPFAVIWIILSLIGIFRFKLSILQLIFISAIAGFIKYLLS